jgi:hypothetical protein
VRRWRELAEAASVPRLHLTFRSGRSSMPQLTGVRNFSVCRRYGRSFTSIRMSVQFQKLVSDEHSPSANSPAAVTVFQSCFDRPRLLTADSIHRTITADKRLLAISTQNWSHRAMAGAAPAGRESKVRCGASSQASTFGRRKFARAEPRDAGNLD